MTVLQKTRLKIIVLCVAVLMAIQACLMVCIGVSLTRRVYNENFRFLEQLARTSIRKDSEQTKAEKTGQAPEQKNPSDFGMQPPSGQRLPPPGQAPFGTDSRQPPDKKGPEQNETPLEPKTPPEPAGDSFFKPDNQPVQPGFRQAVSVKLDSSRSSIKYISGENNFFTDDEVLQIAQKVASKNRERGVCDSNFFVTRKFREGSLLICFVNRESNLSMLKNLYSYSAIIYCACLIFAFGICWFFSRFLMKPIEKTIEHHKQFISDASHELRTPISVIDANLSVVMNEYPGNKWLEYIKDENQRMGKLVKDLLYLTRSDQNRTRLTVTDFNLSKAVENAVLPFESVIFEAGKKLELKVEEGLQLRADENSIKQLVTILVDNAVKYSGEGGLIRVTASLENGHKLIKVYNTGSGIESENLEKIFRRFFREDKARSSEKGGYGLGLAIAKSIAELAGGTLTCSSDGENWVEFTLKLR